jgi:hypothetical protein
MPANTDAVVGGMHEILFDAKVAFRRLNTRVPQQQLDLFQFPASKPLDCPGAWMRPM